MATNKTYTVAGTSSFNGKTKVRFAQDYVSRFKILNILKLNQVGRELS